MGPSPSCPACAEPLVVFELDGIEIDRCLACAGTWLDAGELALIAERAGLDPGPILALSASPAPDSGGRPPLARAEAGARLCPRCRGALETIPASGAAEGPVELDRCPRGDGLWFDARELERVLAGAAAGAAGRAVGSYLAKLFRAKNE